jgi:hypothetical protein
VLASFGAEHGRGTDERDGGRRWLLTERKRGKGRGSTWATPHRGRRGGALARSRHTEEDGVGGLVAGNAHGPAGEKKRSGPSPDEQGQF